MCIEGANKCDCFENQPWLVYVCVTSVCQSSKNIQGNSVLIIDNIAYNMDL